MNMLYGYYLLDVNCEEYNALLQSIQDRLMANTTGITGVPVVDFGSYEIQSPVGSVLLSNNGTVVGAGHKTADYSRVWIIPANNGHALFIDGKPNIVEQLGLSYDATGRRLVNPTNGKVLVTAFK